MSALLSIRGNPCTPGRKWFREKYAGKNYRRDLFPGFRKSHFRRAGLYKNKSLNTKKKRGVIITSQELSLFTNLTIEENLNITNLPTKAGFVSRRFLRESALRILQKIKNGKFDRQTGLCLIS